MTLFRDFTAISLIATGTDPSKEEVVEFGAARFRSGRMAEGFSRLANPGRPIPPSVTRLTGICADDVRGRPGPKAALEDFRAFLAQEPVLVTHDVAFAADFLREKGLGDLGGRLFDTLTLSRIAWPHLDQHEPENLAQFIGKPRNGPQRAAQAAALTGEVWLVLLEAIDRLPPAVVQTVLDLLKPVGSSLTTVFERLDAQMAREAMLRASGPLESALPDFVEDVEELRARTEPETPGVPQLLDVDRMARLFSEDGVFARRLKGFEYRPQQAEMTQAICEAFNRGEHAVIEAGTGTGKSLAYLTPAIGWSTLNGQKVVVSTNTKSLQDQLFEKDIPSLREVLKKPFQAVRLKGAGNYLCVRKLLSLFQQAEWAASDEERLALAALVVWATQTATGDVSECSGFLSAGGRELWNRLGLGSNECLSGSCGRRRNCFLLKARGSAMKSDITVVNHALVFSDIGLESSILPPFAHLIFDEAHNMEAVATENLAKEVSSYRLNGLLDRLHHRDGSETGRGIVGSLLFHFTRAKQKPGSPEIRPRLEKAVREVQAAREKSELFFEVAGHLFPPGPERKRGEKGAVPGDRRRYSAETQSGQAWQAVRTRGQWLILSLNDLLAVLNDLPEPLSKSTGLSAAQAAAAEELPWRTDDLSELVQDLDFVLKAEDREFVYWVSRESGRRESLCTFQAAPIDIGPLLLESLFHVKDSVIMVSGTLAMGQSFDFFKQRVGLDRLEGRKARELLLGSCFDLKNQAVLVVPSFLPEPDYQATDFGSELAGVLIDIFKASRGRGLVLCTSYALLEEIYPLLKRGLEPDSILVLAQGIDGEAPKLARIFKSEASSVLLGTQSFWEGFDAPGDTLCCVVLSKLPFPVFTDPIVEARCERLESQNVNSFMNFMVPNAGIRLKQGFGRLIRTATDYGVVVLADKRILTKRYGRILRQALPVELEEYNSRDSVVGRIQQFFAEKDG